MTITPRHPAHPARTAFSLVAAGALVVGLAACGDDSNTAAQPPSTDNTDTIAPPDTTAAPTTVAPGFEHPTGADDVVVEIAYEGGFLPVEMAFAQLPTLLVTGDGRQFTLGPQIEIYPQPLLPNVLVSDIGEEGIQRLLDLAAEHGLLTHREYTRNDMIADAADTVVRISANGETYEHRAYALGSDTEETGERAELEAFVQAVTAELPMDEATYEPDTYLIRATPVEDTSVYDVEPTFVDWPVESSLALAGATDCAEVPATQVEDLFAGANQLTLFVQGDVPYQLSVKPQLPGDAC